MKTKQNICVWCGKRLWWWQRRRCLPASNNEKIWCQTCSDLQRLPKSGWPDLSTWIEAVIVCAIFGLAASLVMFMIKYFDAI